MKTGAAKGTFRRVFAIPLVIAVISLIGLLAALIGDGPLDMMSWIALALPIIIAVWALSRTSRK